MSKRPSQKTSLVPNLVDVADGNASNGKQPLSLQSVQTTRSVQFLSNIEYVISSINQQLQFLSLTESEKLLLSRGVSLLGERGHDHDFQLEESQCSPVLEVAWEAESPFSSDI